MRKMIAMFVIAASVAACNESTEEVVVEGTPVDTTVVLDSTNPQELEDAAYEVEASAE
jgi:hypothetical protein